MEVGTLRWTGWDGLGGWTLNHITTLHWSGGGPESSPLKGGLENALNTWGGGQNST